MIKVHCLISCFCEIIKRRSKVDHRPYYFGIWNAHFHVTEEDTISYYAKDTGFERFLFWYERFFGLKVNEWYDASQDSAYNVNTLLQLLKDKPEHRYVIVQIDMSLLPERENKFHQTPFPHYLVLSETDDPDKWFMFDPDFRWEGLIDKERAIEAILKNPFGGGYYIDAVQIGAPTDEVIRAHYDEEYRPDSNELTSALRELVIKLAAEEGGHGLSKMTAAFKQLQILAIRKYSYDYALLYFKDHMPELNDVYETWAQRIRDLVQAFTTFQYLAVKLSMTRKPEQVPALLEHLDKMDAIEFSIKGEVHRQLLLWTEMREAARSGVR